MPQHEVLDWLMEGDPVVRWQTMRDLLDRPESEWSVERSRVPEQGWGAQFLGALQPDGTWRTSRWTGTVWTLNVLIDLEFPGDNEPVRQAAHQFLETHLTAERASSERWMLESMDICHLGFWLRIGAWFGFDKGRLASVAQFLLSIPMPDGGWNCRIRTAKKTKHGSFHTTFNVLEGLRAAAGAGIVDRETFRTAEARALEFMLMHQMYRSDRTGAVVDERFTHLAFPSYWHYTVLRGLDYMRTCPEIKDPRLADPVAMIEGRRKPNGRWVVEKRIPGETLFEMERMGGESHMNTLRALRVLRAREPA